MKVTVFAPHPDDELIGCGGSVLKWTNTGADVSFVYLTSGDLPTSDGKTRSKLAEVREEEATYGAAIVGVSDLTFLREPDGSLTESADLIHRLVHQIRRERPNLVYIPHAFDDHPDHMATHRLLKRALSDARGPYWSTDDPAWSVDMTLAYEVWTPIQRPTYLEDTTDFIDEQVRALAEHKSQLAMVPYDAFVRGLGSYRGATLSHGRSAEAFEVVKINNLPSFD